MSIERANLTQSEGVQEDFLKPIKRSEPSTEPGMVQALNKYV